LATYTNDTDQALAFPTLGVIVEPGGSFEAPEGLPFPTSVKKSKTTATPAVTDTSADVSEIVPEGASI
jgi:hypothetical protein